HELGIAPAEVRGKDRLPGDPDDRLITGLSLAGITSRESLDRALELVGYETFREEQAAAREEGRHLGIGFATFIEAAPGPEEMRSGGGLFASERAKVSLQPDGILVVTNAQCTHVQNHDTMLTLVAAYQLCMHLNNVRRLQR